MSSKPFELKELKALLSANKITLRKGLGQNLLWHSKALAQIAAAAEITPEDTILEVGPGAGHLSRAILDFSPKKLIALEKDVSFDSILAKIQSENMSFEVIYCDALHFNLKSLEEIKLVSNLPYNISTRLISNWMEQVASIKSLTLTLQAEVADRICATQGDKDYGRLSILCQLYFDCTPVMKLAPEMFMPSPKVHSKVVAMRRKSVLPEKDIVDAVSKLTKLAFSQRRKKLKNSLARMPEVAMEDQLANKRAEEISVGEYIQLAKRLLESEPRLT